MANRTPKFTRKDYQWFVDNIADLFSSPTDINQFARRLRTTNPNFKEDYFVDKMVEKWEQTYLIEQMAEENDQWIRDSGDPHYNDPESVEVA